ncbi:putative phage abortive infection protein [Pseudomonas sp. EA_35y_Pfl2_R5]|uniref:putative phage abortive infection protein n=1 Tax=Pseudomonas sp. EA_35y_Pfl2_R5 TaxID=3088690 RepID=UPI0030DBC28A
MKGRTFAAIIIGIIILWATSGWILYSSPERGTFGDMFGTVNSLFSGLAFAAIIYTIALQRTELSLQRKELELTRGEMTGQKKALEAQSEHMRLQSFEGTFFQMLKLHNELLNSIDITLGTNLYEGRDSFAGSWRRFRSKYAPTPEQLNEDRLTVIQAAYDEFWNIYSGEFGHYFRSLYNILKYIDKTQNIDQQFYANIVRAQISTKELTVIFYNCICKEGEKFKPLIEKYALLKHLNIEDIGTASDTSHYDRMAFGGKI